MKIGGIQRRPGEGSVYVIVNRKTGRRYVGATTMTLTQRCLQHVWQLNHGRGIQSMRADWVRCGERGFEAIVVEIVPDPRLLGDRERFWMDEFRRQGLELYNTRKDGYSIVLADSVIAYRSSEERREKMDRANALARVRRMNAKRAERRATARARRAGEGE